MNLEISKGLVLRGIKQGVQEDLFSNTASDSAEGDCSEENSAELASLEKQPISLEDGTLEYLPDFLSAERAGHWYQWLDRHINWQQPKIKVYGKWHSTPRLTALYGDSGVSYGYSGVRQNATAWYHNLIALKRQIELRTNHQFNHVLLNKYRSGQDTVGWHADDEGELGKNPVIASLSLGGARDFLLRHNQSRETICLTLQTGSLLIMSGCLQHHWQHSIPRRARQSAARINLTFRMLPNKAFREHTID